MEAMVTKYQPIEILQIIQASYRQQQQFDPVVLINQDLTMDTTIADWRDICDLVEASQLGEYLNHYFRLSVDRETWLTQLEPAEERTLGELCRFISFHAKKDIITPIKLFGNNCESAAIFRTLSSKLKDRGIDTSDLRPSSRLEPLVQQHGVTVIEEINLLDPHVLPPVDYKMNWVYRWGLLLFFTFLLLTIFAVYRNSNWAWWTGATSLMGFIMIRKGATLNAKRARFEGIETVADLIRQMNINSR